jgi:hypothetical protein
MSSDSMAIQSFHRSQELLSAINELSIHLKLEAAGVADEQQTARAEEGRVKLLEFLRRLELLIEAAEKKEREPVTGADVRMRQLAQRLIERRSKARGKSPLLTKSMSKVIELLESETPEGREPLLESLRDLRQLLDEHLETDTRALVGGF